MAPKVFRCNSNMMHFLFVFYFFPYQMAYDVCVLLDWSAVGHNMMMAIMMVDVIRLLRSGALTCAVVYEACMPAPFFRPAHTHLTGIGGAASELGNRFPLNIPRGPARAGRGRRSSLALNF